MRGSRTEESGAAVYEPDVGNPVALSSCEAGLGPFTIEARGRTTKERLIETFERVDADYRVMTSIDLTGGDRNCAASSAGVELRGSCAENVFGYQGGLLDDDVQSGARTGGPHSTVLGTERAGACASRDFDRIRLPSEGERDIPAVTLTLDQHACSLRYCSVNEAVEEVRKRPNRRRCDQRPICFHATNVLARRTQLVSTIARNASLVRS